MSPALEAMLIIAPDDFGFIAGAIAPVALKDPVNPRPNVFCNTNVSIASAGVVGSKVPEFHKQVDPTRYVEHHRARWLLPTHQDHQIVVRATANGWRSMNRHGADHCQAQARYNPQRLARKYYQVQWRMHRR